MNTGIFNKPLSTFQVCDSRTLYPRCRARATRKIKFCEAGIQVFYCDACASKACEFYTFPE